MEGRSLALTLISMMEAGQVRSLWLAGHWNIKKVINDIRYLGTSVSIRGAGVEDAKPLAMVSQAVGLIASRRVEYFLYLVGASLLSLGSM